MKHRFLFLTFMVAMTMNVFGQDTIYAIDTIRAEYSIIRHYKDQIDISYNLQGGQKTFAYTDRATNTVKFFDVSYGYNIFDFEISNGVVYFCGNVSPDKGLFGWFDIDSNFVQNSGSIHYCELNTGYSSAFLPGYTDNI